MSKNEMIEQIRRHNRSASDEFLCSFDEQVLADYLDRLMRLVGRRGRRSVWVRQGSGRAISGRVCA